MAIGATIFRFSIELSDVDRGVFASLQLRIAQHPSESLLFFVVRALARCLVSDAMLYIEANGSMVTGPIHRVALGQP